jgi:hypothetical protein
MIVDVKIFKKEGTYINNEGKEKQFTNFYLQANDKMIPIEVKYFAQDKFDGRDPGYQGRVAVLSLLAQPFPEKEVTAE